MELLTTKDLLMSGDYNRSIVRAVLATSDDEQIGLAKLLNGITVGLD